MSLTKVTASMLAAGAAVSNVGTGGITANELATDAVETAKIKDAAVETAKIKDANVTPAKLSQPMTLGTVQATTSGNAITFSSIPSWAKRITLSINAVSTTGAAAFTLQLGTSGGVQATGYSGSSAGFGNAAYPSVANISTFFPLGSISSASDSVAGVAVLTLIDAATGLWVCAANIGQIGSAAVFTTIGDKSLSGTLDRIVFGTDSTFDAGSVNILYEG